MFLFLNQLLFIIFESSGGGLGPKELIRLDGSNSLSVKILHPPQRTSDGIDLPPGGMISGDEVLLLRGESASCGTFRRREMGDRRLRLPMPLEACLGVKRSVVQSVDVTKVAVLLRSPAGRVV